MTKVLIIEDDEELGTQLMRHMESAQLKSRWLRDGHQLVEEELLGVELVILDLMLPSMSGLDVLKHLRTFSDVPVLILSARSDTTDKIRGLKLGADDYMTKPFWPEELVERVRARLRRPVMSHEQGVQIGTLKIDRKRREVFVEGSLIALTPIEFELVGALAERPGAALTRGSLVDRALGDEADERTLDVHISRVRKKLGASRIKTVWGIGYRLVAGDEP